MKTKNRTPANPQERDPRDPDPTQPEPEPTPTETANAAEPSNPDPNNADPADSEPSDAEPRDSEPSNTESGDAEAGDTEASDADETQQPNGKRTVALALVVVAAVCAAWFGWSWYGAAHDEALHYSSARDEALHAGEQAIQNLNTLDYRSLDEGLKVWQDSSTSQLYQQIVQGRQGFEQAVRKAQTITSAKVLDAAVTELDQHAGKASVIVALQVTVTPPKGDPTVKKTRLMGQLTRTSTGWKLSALAPAPVGSGG
ncbi:hypothetical protein ACQP1W_42235 [Spirillospora sp. CA-255316]